MNESLKDQLVSSLHRFRKLGRNLPPELGLNMGELFVLQRIKRDMPCSGSDIAAGEVHEHPHFTKPAVSQMLNSLEKKGYVHREIDKNDRRRIVVTLTEAGSRALGRGLSYMDDRMERTISRFGEDDTRRLIELLNRLADISEELKQGGAND